MFFKSIRWRLQLWYGLILTVVLSGFGFTAYQLQRIQEFEKFDNELQEQLSTLASSLRPVPPPLRNRDSTRRPPPSFAPEDDFPGPFREPREPLLRERPLTEPPRNHPEPLRLSPQQAAAFEGDLSHAFYFVLWSREGREITRSANAPADATRPNMTREGALPIIRQEKRFREAYLTTPRGDTILAGRSAQEQMERLEQLAWSLFGVGGVVLVLGCAGGWWIAGRAIHPVKEISDVALKIFGGDLSRRIHTSDTDSELGQLATILNSTFARLDAAFSQQTRFTADAAHELRTPVSVMLTQTQTALARERSANEYRETLEVCQRATQRMRRLIESLLELARLDAGQENMKRIPVELDRLVHDCIELVKPLADEREITIESHLQPCRLHGDPERLGQVVMNLITNAIHYNRPRGIISVTTESDNDFAVLVVKDTGIGISQEDLPRIFDRFFRSETSRSAGKAGLGLSISKAIIESHGGSILVTSKPGEGASFTVRLPRSPSE